MQWPCRPAQDMQCATSDCTKTLSYSLKMAKSGGGGASERDRERDATGQSSLCFGEHRRDSNGAAPPTPPPKRRPVLWGGGRQAGGAKREAFRGGGLAAPGGSRPSGVPPNPVTWKCLRFPALSQDLVPRPVTCLRLEIVELRDVRKQGMFKCRNQQILLKSVATWSPTVLQNGIVFGPEQHGR